MCILMTIIICLVGSHYRRAFDGIRYWSKVHGITKLYLLYSEPADDEEPTVFSYMSRENAEDLREKLETALLRFSRSQLLKIVYLH